MTFLGKLLFPGVHVMSEAFRIAATTYGLAIGISFFVALLIKGIFICIRALSTQPEKG
jgi:hypothetical protein